jgi:hypothetical protein
MGLRPTPMGATAPQFDETELVIWKSLKTEIDKTSALAFRSRNDRNIRCEIVAVLRNRIGGSTIGIPSQLREECNAECSLVSIVGQSAPG